jgi:hypothetical protein
LAKRDKRISEIADWLFEICMPDLGWVYAEGSHRIDLIHQSYILNNLLLFIPVKTLEEAAISILSHFAGPNMVIDKFDVTTVGEGKKAAARSGSVYTHFFSNMALVFHNEPARYWSIGEMLVVMSKFYSVGNNRKYWLSTIKRYTSMILTSDIFGVSSDHKKRFWFRHTLHIAHGLSKVLEVRRANYSDLPLQYF